MAGNLIQPFGIKFTGSASLSNQGYGANTSLFGSSQRKAAHQLNVEFEIKKKWAFRIFANSSIAQSASISDITPTPGILFNCLMSIFPLENSFIFDNRFPLVIFVKELTK
jgi:hypothetical protein